MPDDFLSTKEAAEHRGIHEKQVYALVKAGKIPASRVTGKWLFPRRLLDEWIEGLSWVITKAIGNLLMLAPASLVWAFALAVVFGFLFTLYPAWRASRLSPMEALRYE